MPDARVSVRVTPRASSSRAAGLRGRTLLVRVTAPPVDGAANAAVCKLVAKELGVPKSSVSIARGETSRDKVLTVVGLNQEEVDARLGIDAQPELF